MKIIYLLFLVLIAACSNTSEETDCNDYHMVYISKASGNFDIYINDFQGNEKQLTTNPSWDWSPVWNPASGAIIYYSYVNDTFQIRKMSIDGDLMKIDTKGLTEFNLSPDGTSVVMEENQGDNRQLVLISLEDMNRRTSITDSASYNGRAKWSPDSKKIVYISDRDGNNEVYLYDLVSKSTTRLTEKETSEKYLTWAPDSKRIAYTTEYYEEGEPDRNDVFVMDITSLETTQITNNQYEDSEIIWSPDGNKIAFHSKRDSVDHIFTMNVDGTGVKQITSQNTYHGEPSWIVVKKTCE